MRLVRGKFTISCQQCDTSFEVYYSWRNRKYCSRKCQHIAFVGRPGYHKGIKATPETIRKLRESHLGQKAWNKGKPAPWARYDLLLQPEVRKKALERSALVNSQRRDDKHWEWKGDNVGYRALHDWVVKRLGKPMLCEECGIKGLNRYHWANKSGDYKRDLSDWIRLCPKCHKQKDRFSMKEVPFVRKGNHYSKRKDVIQNQT